MILNKDALVITTIASSSNYILKKYAKLALKNNIEFIIIGDKKSLLKFSLKGANYFSINLLCNFVFNNNCFGSVGKF